DVQLCLRGREPPNRRLLCGNGSADASLTLISTSDQELTIMPFLRAIRRHPSVVFGATILAVFVLVAVFAPWLNTVDAASMSPAMRNKAPSPEHWFGTDAFGRDLYSRVLYGSGVSLTVGLSVAIIAWR